VGIVLFGLAVRLYGLNWGLPNVYEEAIPLKTAWSMWNWERPAGVDLNPHFFNYPSLMIYVHFVVQGLMYGLMKLRGVIDSSIDYQVRYLVDPTSWYIAGRFVSTLIALGTVLFTYFIGRRLGGVFAGLLASFFMAVNVFHAERSQMIEVDVPLTFAVTVTLLAALRMMTSPKVRNYIIAGLAFGLAASTKYTGAMLILPIVVAHFLGRRDTFRTEAYKPSHVLPVVVLFVASLTFAAISPYVFFDSQAFLHDFSLERVHMSVGHFGLSGESSPVFYSKSLGNDLLGWPLAVVGVGGLVFFLFVRRRYVALVLAAFVLPYVLAISTWSMHADRYLLPVLPVLTVFAAALIEHAVEFSRSRSVPRIFRFGVVALVVLVVAVPAISSHVRRVRASKSDTRTNAREWIEANVPSGSYIVTEAYGPELFSAGSLLQIQPDARQRVITALSNRPLYAIHVMQMYQGKAEKSAVFYNHALYENADYFVTSSAVRSRYERAPQRFPAQMAFYKTLDEEFIKIKEIQGKKGTGPTQIIYRNPGYAMPFAIRTNVVPPRRIVHDDRMLTGGEGRFYLTIGLNYEVYSHVPEAIQSYEYALEYAKKPGLFTALVMRKTSCLLKMRKFSEVLEFLRFAVRNAPDDASRAQFMEMRESLSTGTRPKDR
jgi:hypothetical protein